jgi:hypothetical protein
MVRELDGTVRRTLQALAISIGFLALGGIQTAATTFLKVEFACPIGGQKFKATIVTSNTFWGRRLDLKPVAPTPSSVPGLLPVCPENGFVMYKREFSDEELSKLASIVLSEGYQKARAENTSYFLVAYMHAQMGADDRVLASLYLEASWEAEPERPELVTRYRSLALEKLDVVLGRGQTWGDVLLAAELERLLNRFDAAGARLAAVPNGVLDEGQSKMLEQIRNHAQNRNSEPQPFVAK